MPDPSYRPCGTNPTHLPKCNPNCGSWLACDAVTSVIQAHRVDTFAGKPAPTIDRARPHTPRCEASRS
ncbi:hypothetical protein DK871_28460 [Pseudomonas sp. L13]|nr:hypothetical protein [Pseudomonas sp. L13]